MKKIILLFIISLFLISCGNIELKENRAFKICDDYIKMHQQATQYRDVIVNARKEADNISIDTYIAIDRIYQGHGWPLEKYNQLVNQGLINLTNENNGIKMSLTQKGEEYLEGISPINSTYNQLIFKGYKVLCDEADISSNAKDKKAEADMVFKISSISPIQEVFNKPKNMIIRIKVNFKLFDSGWKIVDDEYAKELLQFNDCDNPMH
jgi:hypothetical protein